MWPTCVATVRSEMSSLAATCLLLRPSATNWGDLEFPPGEGSAFAAMRRGDLVIIGFTKSEPHCGVSCQAFACLKFSSELRLSQIGQLDQPCAVGEPAG